MKTNPCGAMRDRLDSFVHGETGTADAVEVRHHLAACGDCAGEAERIRRADRLLDAVRGDALLGAVPDAVVSGARLKALAQIRSEAPVRRPSLFGYAWGLAIGVALLGLALTLHAPAPNRATVSARPVVPAGAADVAVVTVATSDGVTLRWKGPNETYLVMRSSRPASFENAEITTVCGHSWTDRGSSSGAVYYRVVLAHERCQS